MYFFALSHAPPVFEAEIATCSASDKTRKRNYAAILGILRKFKKLNT